MAIKDARVDVILQRIEEDVGDEVKVEPTHIKRYGVNNIFQRTLTYLFGWNDAGKPIKLQATSAGWLKVAASSGAIYEHLVREAGIATVSKSNFTTFSPGVAMLDVFVKDYEMWIYMSNDGITEEGKIRCLPNLHNIFELTCVAFKVERAGVNDVEYEVLGVR